MFTRFINHLMIYLIFDVQLSIILYSVIIYLKISKVNIYIYIYIYL